MRFALNSDKALRLLSLFAGLSVLFGTNLFLYPNSILFSFICLPMTLFVFAFINTFAPSAFYYLLAAFIWGGFNATSLSVLAEHQMYAYFPLLFPHHYLYAYSCGIGIGLIEELSKIIGVIAIFLFVPTKERSPLLAFLIGGAAGLGFNFTESVAYMNASFHSAAWGGVWQQFQDRQILGLLAFHFAYTSIAALGLGLSYRYKNIFFFALSFSVAVMLHGVWDGWGVMYSTLPTYQLFFKLFLGLPVTIIIFYCFWNLDSIYSSKSSPA